MNTKPLYRLAWKEVRALRSFWLALLVMAVGLQGFLSWSVGNVWAPSQTNFLVPIWIPVMFSLAGAAVAFAGEREEGTDQFLGRLAVPPLTLWSVKIATNLFGTILLAAVLFPLAWATGCLSLGGRWYVLREGWRDGGPVMSMCFMALIWQINFLAWGVFLSLLCRRVLTCVVLTTIASVLTPLAMSPILDSLPLKQAHSEAFDWTVRLVMIPGLLLFASSQLVRTWDENRWPRLVELLIDGWRRLTATRERSEGAARTMEQRRGGWRIFIHPLGLCLPDEWLPAWRREARRLLWLEWRQARRVLLFVLAAFGVYAVCQGLFVAWGSVLLVKEFPFVMALISFVFGAWSFQGQQSGERYRDFAGHGASPATMWFIKQGVWFAVTLLTVALLMPMTGWLSGGRHAVDWLDEPQALWRSLGYGLSSGELSYWSSDRQLLSESLGSPLANAVLAVGLCFAVGQLVSLLMARAVTVATVGFVLAALAFAWQQLTALAAIPSWLAVLPLIVGLLLASAVRMTDWLEQRNAVLGWLRVIAACVVPSLVTLVGVPIYRVVEIPAVNYATFSSDDINALRVKTTDVSPAAKQTAQRWIQLAESIEDVPVFQRSDSSFRDASQRVVEEGSITIRFMSEISFDVVSWNNLRDQTWLAQNLVRVNEAARIAEQPDCAFDRDLFQGFHEPSNFQARNLTQLAVLLKMAAESAIAEGKLDEGLQHGLVLLRLSEHIQQHAPWWSVHNGELLESATWSLLIRWARHPAQTGDSLRSALGRSANATRHPLREALQKHVELLPPPSQVVVEEYLATKQELTRHWQEAVWPVSWMIWEQERESRLLDFSAAIAMSDMHELVSDSRETWEGDRRLVHHPAGVHRPESRQRMLAGFLQNSTRNPDPSRQDPFVWCGYSFTWQRANERCEAAVWCRGLIATLALRAFQLDHARWPTQWDELIGPYLDRVPVDPWTGLTFELRPQGYPFEIETRGGRIPAHTPLFVSGGQHDQRFVPVVRPPVDGATSTTTEWVSISPLQPQPQPIKGSTRTLSLIAFPLSATATDQ